MPNANDNGLTASRELLRDAENAWLSGDHSGALRLLFRGRRDAAARRDRDAVCSVNLGFASQALAADDEWRAEQILGEIGAESLEEAANRARVWLVRTTLAQRRPGFGLPRLAAECEALIAGLEDSELVVGVRLGQAAVERLEGRPERALALVQLAQETVDRSSPRYGLAELERAEILLALEDQLGARTALHAALASFSRLGLRLCEGKTCLRYGEALGTGALQGEAPVAWFVRAQSTFGSSASAADRSRIRAGFRRYGRRLADHAVSAELSSRIDSLEHAYSLFAAKIALHAWSADAVLEPPGNAASRSDCSTELRSQLDRLPSQLEPLGLELHRVTTEISDLFGTALVDRARMESLVRGMTEMDGATSAEQLATRSAAIISSILEADRVIVTSRVRGQLTALADIHSAGEGIADSAWREAVEALPPSRDLSVEVVTEPVARSVSRPRGPVLVVPARSESWDGAIYADKLERKGKFRDSDFHITFVLAEFLALNMARFAAREAEKVALAQLAGTLGALRDGVVALDASGTIQQVNSAAARMLGGAEAAMMGKRLSELPGLAPLALALLPPRAAEGVIVRLPRGSVVLAARPVDMGLRKGVIATLVELERAQRVAVRVSNPRPRYSFADVVGRAPALLDAMRLATQAAALDAPLLITGESGTGKEVFAQAVHNAGPRAQEPFVGINCAALPNELLEAELFGYERGAFTGARADGALGKFEQAGEGTLLLDEIGDMPLGMQAKLLRVLEERSVTRLGGGRERPVRARIIATTNQSLETSVARRSFRLDLLYRLRVLQIVLPPLRERPEDIDLLARFFVERVAQRQNRLVPGLSQAALLALQRHSWPGNVRELVNVIERGVGLLPARASVIEDLPLGLGAPVSAPSPSAWDPRQSVEQTPAQTRTAARRSIVPFAEVERRTFLDALGACDGHVSAAAKALGVSRASFYAKLQRWGLREADGPASTGEPICLDTVDGAGDMSPEEPPTLRRDKR